MARSSLSFVKPGVAVRATTTAAVVRMLFEQVNSDAFGKAVDDCARRTTASVPCVRFFRKAAVVIVGSRIRRVGSLRSLSTFFRPGLRRVELSKCLVALFSPRIQLGPARRRITRLAGQVLFSFESKLRFQTFFFGPGCLVGIVCDPTVVAMFSQIVEGSVSSRTILAIHALVQGVRAWPTRIGSR